tara:strand:- start:71 stop:385 length:315 start_codon:yes stop_codon:yes gene_type:complete
MINAIEAIKEASSSVACLLDEPTEVTVKDLEYIQNQISRIENCFLINGDCNKIENLTNEETNTELCYLMGKDVRNTAQIAVLKTENLELKGRLQRICESIREVL